MSKGIDFIGVCVVYFCHDGQGRFIMAKRGAASRDEIGRWDIGGGGVEFGESVEDTIRREVQEEYNAPVKSFEFLGYRDVHRFHEGNPTHWIALDFKVLVDPNQVRNNEPHKFDDLDWFTLDTLPEAVHSQLPDFLARYKDKLKARQ
jgi:8-oxo-dGTP pyrophosphatase MutT (NUDIX family)